MTALEREQLLQELIGLAEGKATSAETEGLLDLMHGRLQCPEVQHGDLPKVLDSVLRNVVTDQRGRALMAFQRNGGKLDIRTPDATVAYVAAFGDVGYWV